VLLFSKVTIILSLEYTEKLAIFVTFFDELVAKPIDFSFFFNQLKKTCYYIRVLVK